MDSLKNINDDLDNLGLGNSFLCNPKDCAGYFVASESNIKILHMNIRSVKKNFDQLQALICLTKINIDVIVLTECWLSKINNPPVLNGYMSHSTKLTSNQNEGVIIYSKLSLNATIWEPCLTNSNSLVCQIDSKFAFVAVYRSPSYNTAAQIENFLSSLNNILEDLSSYPNIALIGDLNIDIKPGNSNPHSLEYLILNASHGLLPTHLLPTRLENCLDHILLKSKLSSTTLVLESYITDHKPIILMLTTAKQNQNPKLYKSRPNLDAIKSELQNINFTDIYNIQDTNELLNTFISQINTVIINNTSKIIIPRRQRILKPWITPGLLKCIQNRDQMHMRSKKSPNNSTLKITYTRYRNFCNDLLRNLKLTYEKCELQKAQSNPKELWKTIQDITNTRKVRTSPDKLLKISDNPQSSVNQVCSYFSNIGKKLADDIIKINRQPTTPSNNNLCESLTPIDSLVLLEVNETEVDSIISQLRNDCAVGWDGISSSLLRKCRQELVPPLTYICNRCIQTGTFPDALKKAIILPIYKSGNKDCVNNYRPISILPSISKIIEKILNKQLKGFLNKHRIIAKNQYGFKAGVSTEDAVLDLTQFVARELDGGSKCMGIFLDLSKAFDTVSVPKLLTRMERLGVRGTALEMFKDYLKNRSQLVKIGDHLSEEETVTYGVPQGSILGPTMFLIYMNDLCRMIIPNCKIYAYADDTAIVIYGPTWDMVKTTAENALSQIMNWFHDSLLTLNLDKTCYIPFAMRRNTMPPTDFTIIAHSCQSSSNTCTCSTLDRCDSVKYLGVQIDECLRWDKQLDMITSRILRLIYVFKSLRDPADMSTLRMVYFALCQSIIGYCITAWGGASKTNLLRAERAQRAVLKVMCKKPYRYPTKQLYEDCEVLTVRQLFILQSALRTHRSMPKSNPKKRTNVPSGVKHKTSFAQHQFYVLSNHLYKNLHKKLNILDLNRYMLRKEISKWLLQQDYVATENLLTYIS